MSAFTPPRVDLREGKQSADSFIMSRRIFAQSASLCFFANNFQMIRGLTPREANPLTLALIRAIPRGSGSRQSSFSNHVHTSDRWYVREQWVVRKSLSAKATRSDTATMNSGLASSVKSGTVSFRLAYMHKRRMTIRTTHDFLVPLLIISETPDVPVG